MIEFLFQMIGESFKRIDYTIVHMSTVQLSVVAFVGVAIGFLALRSQRI